MFFLILLFAFPIGAYADPSGTQDITVSIPCRITLQIGKNGSLTVNGTTYTGNAFFTAPVGTVLAYNITPGSGYKIAAFIYGGSNVTSKISGGSYTAPALTDHITVSVSFAPVTLPPGEGGNPVPSIPDGGNTPSLHPSAAGSANHYFGSSPRTGDDSRIALWVVLFISAAGLVFALPVFQRRNQK